VPPRRPDRARDAQHQGESENVSSGPGGVLLLFHISPDPVAPTSMTPLRDRRADLALVDALRACRTTRVGLSFPFDPVSWYTIRRVILVFEIQLDGTYGERGYHTEGK
jgi:hypothetical protein